MYVSASWPNFTPIWLTQSLSVSKLKRVQFLIQESAAAPFLSESSMEVAEINAEEQVFIEVKDKNRAIWTESTIPKPNSKITLKCRLISTEALSKWREIW